MVCAHVYITIIIIAIVVKIHVKWYPNDIQMLHTSDYDNSIATAFSLQASSFAWKYTHTHTAFLDNFQWNRHFRNKQHNPGSSGWMVARTQMIMPNQDCIVAGMLVLVESPVVSIRQRQTETMKWEKNTARIRGRGGAWNNEMMMDSVGEVLCARYMLWVWVFIIFIHEMS